jgi:NAD(P)-dependent dehydrogenase (short-subunit alcohol dehydrogenase family)
MLSVSPHLLRTDNPEVALVSGGNAGIGFEIVRGLAAAGLTVHLGCRDLTRGARAAAALVAAGLDVRPVRLDVTDPESISAAVAQVERTTERLDVLVNNAGVAAEWGVDIADQGVVLLRTVFEVNIFGTVELTRASLPLLRESPNARVVNMSSPLGSLALLSRLDDPIASRGLLGYSASKAAVNAVTLVHAAMLRRAGIRVNAANPGLVPTGLNADSPVSRGVLTPAEGARAPVALALTGPDGPTGTFRGSGDDAGSIEVEVPW